MIRFLFFIFFFSQAAFAKPLEIHLWHQMMYAHRDTLASLIKDFETLNPDISIKALYRETEELRSAFQSAAMAGSGPELIFGPSDQVGPFVAMKLIQPLTPFFSEVELSDLHDLAVIRDGGNVYALGDSIGNNLMLIYNKKLVSKPPATMGELVKAAKAHAPENGYGLVFNFNEPFFLQPWIHAFGPGFMQGKRPLLNTPAVRSAFEWFLSLREQKIIPAECDYEMANALFKEGRAPFIVNGDWSWGDYKAAGMDFGIAPLPRNEETDLWPSPLVSTRAYSLNKNLKSEAHKAAAVKFIRFMLEPSSQKKFTQAVGIFPSQLSLQKDPDLLKQPLFKETRQILSLGFPMPIFPEVRAVWDALRTELQGVMAKTVTPTEAAQAAQELATKQIQTMNQIEKPGDQAVLVRLLMAIFIIFLILKVSQYFRSGPMQFQGVSNFAVLMLLPAFIIVFAVVIYPFVYNFLISISNFSLRTFQDWQVVGFSHYLKILSEPDFYILLLKTLVWTGLNVFFHTLIGVILALAIDRTLPAKPFWRALLIIPWAVPQYITALTWRGLFHQEYGPINVFLRDFLQLSPVAWLSQPVTAFSACLLTNIWLGFPFMMVVALGGLQSIPGELYEAARLDGANAWQRFKLITWPLLQPVMRPAMALGALWTFNNFNVVWLVSNGGEPADKIHILVTSIYKSAFQLYQYGNAAAGSLLIFLILLAAATWGTRRSTLQAAASAKGKVL